MSYVKELRALVGSRPLILPGAGVLILNEAGEVLLQRRTDNGTWGIPGGFMEPGERLEETARREVWEETGLTVGAMELFGIFSGPALHYRYPHGDEVYNVSAVYISREVAGIPAQGVELRWFTPSLLPGSINPPHMPILERFCADGRGRESRSGGSISASYIGEVRQLIGNRPLLICGAAIIVRDEQGRILLQKSADFGHWAWPGGSMELGESLEETARREVREETGIEVGPLTLVTVLSEEFVVYPNGDQAHIISAVYTAQAVGGHATADGHETLSVAFFPPDALPRPIFPLHERVIRSIIGENARS